MKIVDLAQGTPEWHAHRAKFKNASDAPAMMGCSSYKTRTALLTEKKTGITPEVAAATQRVFDDGHRYEALSRPYAEDIIGETLYPCVGILDDYSASFDGLTLMQDVNFEHKTLNDRLRAAFDAMPAAPQSDDLSQRVAASGELLPLEYRVQMEHQHLVSGAEKTLFVASQWSRDGELIDRRACWYNSDLSLRAEVVAGWAQFDADLATHVPPASVEAKPVGRAPESLPALRIELSGAVSASNLDAFKAVALDAIRAVNKTLKTDEDFADAALAVKWCADVESRVAAAKEHALSQTADIDALFRALDEITEEAKRVRLDLDKLVKRRKEEVKSECVQAARAALDEAIAVLNAEHGLGAIIVVPTDFAGVIKGMRSVASMNDALSTALAKAKIEANTKAATIRANVALFKTAAAGNESLFPDLASIVNKAQDDFAAVVSSRIAAKAKEDEARQAAEAKRAAEVPVSAEPAAGPVTAAVAPMRPAQPVRTSRAVKRYTLADISRLTSLNFTPEFCRKHAGADILPTDDLAADEVKELLLKAALFLTRTADSISA